MNTGQGDTQNTSEGQSSLLKRLAPVLNGLFAAALVTLTLLVAVALATEDGQVVAGLSETPTNTAPAPTVTPSLTPTWHLLLQNRPHPVPRPHPHTLANALAFADTDCQCRLFLRWIVRTRPMEGLHSDAAKTRLRCWLIATGPMSQL